MKFLNCITDVFKKTHQLWTLGVLIAWATVMIRSWPDMTWCWFTLTSLLSTFSSSGSYMYELPMTCSDHFDFLLLNKQLVQHMFCLSMKFYIIVKWAVFITAVGKLYIASYYRLFFSSSNQFWNFLRRIQHDSLNIETSFTLSCKWHLRDTSFCITLF